VVLTKHFPAGAMWCWSGNTGLKFVLVEQIHNARLLEGWHWRPLYSQPSKLVLPFFGGEKMGSTPGQLWPGHPCKTYISSPAIIFWGVLVFFQVSRPGPAIHWHISPSAPPTAGTTQIGAKSVTVQTVSQNALYWPKLNSQHIRNFKDSDFCVLRTSSVTWSIF
jgi:hypothetical protein